MPSASGCVATLNNIGVATEILGMLVFALILLFFANHQSPTVLTETFGAQDANGGNMVATFALAFFMSIFIMYGFDTAGTFGEETIDASRQAPRGVLSSVWISGAVGVVFLLAVILSLEDIPARDAGGPRGRLPDRDDDHVEPEHRADRRHHGRRDLPVRHPGVGLRVHDGDPGCGDPDDVLDGSRPAPAIRAASGATSAARFQTPANAAVAVGILAAIPILLVGPIGGITLSIAATGLIYLSYFLCNIGLAIARRRGWPHQKAYFSLGRWGMPVNILALIWGALMLINIGLWASPELFGDFGGEGRGYWNPLINGLFKVNGQPARWAAGLAALRDPGRAAARDRGDLLPASPSAVEAADVEADAGHAARADRRR